MRLPSTSPTQTACWNVASAIAFAGFTAGTDDAIDLGCGRNIYRPAAIAGLGAVHYLAIKPAGAELLPFPWPAVNLRGTNVKRIRVAVPNNDDCMRCERILEAMLEIPRRGTRRMPADGPARKWSVLNQNIDGSI
jgi:hypothetical protein